MIIKAIFVLLLLYMGPVADCRADLGLSVNPIDGSNSLRFEGTYAAPEFKKEIHIRVISTNGERYQVFQRVLEPVINSQGEALNLQAITAETLPNSNTAGTLFLQNSGNLQMGDQLLYSSGPSGQSDGFMIGYSLNPALINAGGNFTGRLVFTVRGVGDASNDQAIIDIFLENPSTLKITVQGGHDPDRVRVHATDASDRSADFVTVSFSGNTGQPVRIYQQVDDLPQNETDEELGQNVLQMDYEGPTGGLRTPGVNALNPGRSLIYSGSNNQDNFSIYFLANAAQVQQQGAGTYRGKITYLVEAGQNTQEFPINYEFEVPPVFTMNVTTPDSGGINFTHVLANSPPQEQEVIVTVASNLHKPYQVAQDMETNMTDPQGKEFDNKYLSIQVYIPDGQKGRSDFTQFSPIETGEYPVFSSDASGSGATFKVLYRLQGYPQMTPGDFSVPIRFSLDQK
jgi:hypothetical protein